MAILDPTGYYWALFSSRVPTCFTQKNKFAVKYDWTDQRSHIRGSSSSKKHEDQQQIFPIPIGDELRQPNEQQ